MKISVIIPTINRQIELDKMLQSLCTQTYSNFETIVVDQNSKLDLKNILDKYPQLKIHHIKTAPLGASNARNVGAQLATGDILTFPDDDCMYFKDTLNQAINLIKERSLITGKCISSNGITSVVGFNALYTKISIWNVWSTAVEATIFINKNLFIKLKGFNESLGVGAPTPYGAGEGTDLLIRALKMGIDAYYYPELTMYHPQVTSEYTEKEFKRAYSYSTGIGRVHKINQTPVIQRLIALLRPLLGAILYFVQLNIKKSKFHYFSFKGRVRGLCSK
ncbi:MAG: glycosyltransferase family 2 protein [Bdellovibrionota bacterium]